MERKYRVYRGKRSYKDVECYKMEVRDRAYIFYDKVSDGTVKREVIVESYPIEEVKRVLMLD